MKKHKILAISVSLAATGALAHTGVDNAAVKARMDSMSEIAKNMKILGNMAKGASEFDAQQARIAVDVIANKAAKTISLFEANETDPKSEAKPEIWKNFDDFKRKSDDLERVALKYSGAITTVDDLRAAMGSIGQTCKACHSEYRK